MHASQGLLRGRRCAGGACSSVKACRRASREFSGRARAGLSAARWRRRAPPCRV
ncbi:uncharacterized protein AruCF_2676 [Achromobacter ruhlandii]|nr:uncharacterized protein AruCF_2676 [Achromobacter ruhlandii]